MTQENHRLGDPASGPERHEKDAAGAARLRDHIDKGGAADKVAASDPAAVPLGTDAEAAGAPPTRREVALAEAAERHRCTPGERKPGLFELLRSRWRARVLLALMAGAIAVIALLATLGGSS